jgi:hydroxyethylthiazole kinase
MIDKIFDKVRKEKPLIHHITNWVTIYDCANITRAFGALPVMAHAKEESGDMTKIASALALNIGTLTPELIQSMILAGTIANKKDIPVVLDAVGVGATKLRDDKAFELLEKIKVNIIKGNASEIARIAGKVVVTKGVESTEVKDDLIDISKKLARERCATIVITGKNDIITDGNRVFLVRNGHKMMGNIVGTGCMATSVIASFAAVEKDYTFASSAALSCFGIAGELAVIKSNGPGSFKQNFYDEVFNLNSKIIKEMSKVEEIK